MSKTRQPWTNEQIETLLTLAQRQRAVDIAAELGRPAGSVAAKAHQLGISLRFNPDTARAFTSEVNAPILVGASPIPRQFPPTPMRVFPVREHALDVPVQRPHDADPRVHQRLWPFRLLGLFCFCWWP
jgi:hypothetical protein